MRTLDASKSRKPSASLTWPTQTLDRSEVPLRLLSATKWDLEKKCNMVITWLSLKTCHQDRPSHWPFWMAMTEHAATTVRLKLLCSIFMARLYLLIARAILIASMVEQAWTKLAWTIFSASIWRLLTSQVTCMAAAKFKKFPSARNHGCLTGHDEIIITIEASNTCLRTDDKKKYKQSYCTDT